MIKNNKLLIWIGIILSLMGLLLMPIYRDYINSNNKNDYGIADSLPSYINVVGLSLMLLVSQLYKPERFPQLYFLFVTIGSISYELIQYKLSGILDIYDILASIAGGITAFLIFWVSQRYGKNIESHN